MQPGDYLVKPTCIRDKNALKHFLESNAFTREMHFENNPSNNQYLIVINVIHRTYFEIDRYFLFEEAMTENEFLNSINYYPEGNIIRKKLFTEDDELLYDGYTLNDKPYGLGTLYFKNGSKYQERIFDFKGLSEGREYYPNGNVRFEGIWMINTAYGPNFPILGNLFDENGKLMFSGKFEVKRRGVGYPMMKYPRFSPQKDRPKVEYIHPTDLEGMNVKSRSEKINSI